LLTCNSDKNDAHQVHLKMSEGERRSWLQLSQNPRFPLFSLRTSYNE